MTRKLQHYLRNKTLKLTLKLTLPLRGKGFFVFNPPGHRSPAATTHPSIHRPPATRSSVGRIVTHPGDRIVTHPITHPVKSPPKTVQIATRSTTRVIGHPSIRSPHNRHPWVTHRHPSAGGMGCRHGSVKWPPVVHRPTGSPIPPIRPPVVIRSIPSHPSSITHPGYPPWIGGWTGSIGHMPSGIGWGSVKLPFIDPYGHRRRRGGMGGWDGSGIGYMPPQSIPPSGDGSGCRGSVTHRSITGFGGPDKSGPGRSDRDRDRSIGRRGGIGWDRIKIC